MATAFRVRLNCIDHYQGIQTRYDPQLRNDIRPSQRSKEPKVPTIRIFGSTETGQKVCVHLHGAFPYLFVEYTGSLDPDQVGAYIYRLHLSIDHALAVSYRRDVYRDQPKFVARITLVKGVPFYGFHVGYRFYLKIYMYNPIVMTRLADLLQQGVIMKRKFQPYEAHLQYLLQFMTDYNLYGCGYLETSKVVFRSPVPQHEDESSTPHLWHSQSIPAAQITEDFTLPRVSHCSIEVDICVQDILNRKAIAERRLHNDFIEREHPIPPEMKLVYSMAGLWRDETKRRKRRMRITNPDSSPFPPEVLVSMSANPRESQPAGWIHENEYRNMIGDLIVDERSVSGYTEMTFDKYVKPVPGEYPISTVLQSVEDLYPQNLRRALGITDETANGNEDLMSSIDVDEIRIFEDVKDQKPADLFPDDSDDELFAMLEAERDAKGTTNIKVEPDIAAGTALRGSGIVNSNIVSSKSSSGSSYDGLYGLTQSGMRTGRPSQIPVLPELIEEAEHHDAITKIPHDGQGDNNQSAGGKRQHSPFVDADPVSKRPRTANGMGRNKLEAFMGKAATEPAQVGKPAWQNAATQDAAVATLKSKGSSSSLNGDKRGKDLGLRFAVVKDPNDPNTRFRLSQPTNSQSSHQDDVDFQKVAFDPDVSFAEQSSSDPQSSGNKSSGHEGGNGSASSALIVAEAKVTAPSLPAMDWASSTKSFVLGQPPPSAATVVSTMREEGVPSAIYQDAFYSKDKDVPQRTREYAGREFRLESRSLPFLPAFDADGQLSASLGKKAAMPPDRDLIALQYERQSKKCSFRGWELAEPPPSFHEVQSWLRQKEAAAKARQKTVGSRLPPPTQKPRAYLSQIDGPTPKNKHGFKYTQKPKSTSVQHEAQYMSTMSLEIHVNTRGKLVPNPEEDEVKCIFWCIKSDENIASSQAPDETMSGLVVLSEDGLLARQIRSQTSVEVVEEASELDLMVRMVEIVRTHDPDILTGYEVHGSSWGYLIERARFKYDFNLCDEFSRMKTQSHGRFGKEADRWGFNTTSTIRVTGRHMINIWRAMRGELNLLQYTMENVVWHVLHRRIPHYSWRTLSDWYSHGSSSELAKVLRYYLQRTRLDLSILDTNELVPRTSEQARLLGVDFFSVFSRGSQFKVESIMFRIAKPENFLLPSPSRKQVGGQNALECLPLVMEPQSAFYTSPLLVLDFQSLYPSIMIAYNYCYSTFLGRIVNWRGINKMGFTEYRRQAGLLELLKEHINIAPNGMMYVKGDIRQSLLAKMLKEILETRVMVKSGMKQDKEDRTLQQLLNNRQLALKLLANVTYGYTSASFSGRMPCSEIADSIVQTARETLERAIAYIHSVDRWQAEVVYGDTDSLFIYLKGRTKDQAFDIGNEISKAVTEMNPRPIKLKFEKVYHPCVLLTKKRYVGYKFETKDQIKPEFDAKGIETVRRDGTPAEQKIEEKALKLLFDTADLSKVKSYFQSQCRKIMRGAVSIQDFCFAKEVKLGTYSDKGPPPPGAIISTKRMLEDARAEPQYGERVPYVVITGAPGARLVDRCVAPEELLVNSHVQLDAEYYISKNLIPPLERIFNLVGANVRQWYDEMPKIQRIRRLDNSAFGGIGQKRTLESYMRSTSCVVCNIKMPKPPVNAFRPRVGSNLRPRDDPADLPVCNRCRADVPFSVMALETRLNGERERYMDVRRVCQTCASLSPLDDVPCDSKDCPVFYTRMKLGARMRAEQGVVEPVIKQLLALDLARDRESLEW
jgi:DNA polymerase zeta